MIELVTDFFADLPVNFLILVIAASLDRLIGDPVNWLHPVQVMGWYISRWIDLTTQPDPMAIAKRVPRFQPLVMRLWGMGLGLSLIIGSGGICWLGLQIAAGINQILAIALASILLAACFAGRSLRDAAMDVIKVLRTGDIVMARQQLSRYVGRDTDQLSELEILRAVLETVTENAIDAVTSPLFYAIIGSLWFDYGGVVLAIAYKAASTLDSMVGYREVPYHDLGWFSAKTDDLLTWLPCRLSVITLAMISGRPIAVWWICQRDAHQDPSPNSGWSECVYAAILRVQLGGTNQYRGVIKYKPLLGDAIEAIAPAKILQALTLTRLCFLLWLSISLACLILLKT